jgi:hypothetical protein
MEEAFQLYGKYTFTQTVKVSYFVALPQKLIPQILIPEQVFKSHLFQTMAVMLIQTLYTMRTDLRHQL